MLKGSTEVCGATDSGDSDISGFSTAIKREIGGWLHFFQLREEKSSKSRGIFPVLCLRREDSSKLRTNQARLLVKGQMGSEEKKDHPSVTGPWSNPA